MVVSATKMIGLAARKSVSAEEQAALALQTLIAC
jgi:hypothetical protein